MRRDRTIWFEQCDEGGVYRPVGRAGCLAFVLAGGWVLACAAVGLIGFASSWHPGWLAAMFVGAGIGLAIFAVTVARHS